MTTSRSILVAALVAVAGAVWAVPADAQPLRQDFRWVSASTWCPDGSPGTDLTSPGGAAALASRGPAIHLSQEQRDRDCRLRIVWELQPRHQGTAYGQAVMNRVHPPQSAGRAVSAGPPERVLATLTPTSPGQWHTQAVIRLRDLQLPARVGMRVPYQAGGQTHQLYADPYFRDFAWAPSLPAGVGARGPAARTPAFRITSLRLNDGARSTSSPTVRLRIDHTGAQATHYMVSESHTMTGGSWRPYSPTYGGSQPHYTLQDRSPGQKRIYVKLRSGTGRNANETEVASATIDYARLVRHNVPSGGLADLVPVLRQRNLYHRVLEPSVYQGSEPCRAVRGTAFSEAAFRAEGRVGGNSCVFQVMPGVTLREGWRMVSATLSGNRRNWGFVQGPRGTRDASFSIRVEGRLTGTTIDWTAIQLEGPAGRNWREAFPFPVPCQKEAGC